MLYISADDIVTIHDAVINEIGGSFGIREPGLLMSIAEKPKANFNGQELYPENIQISKNCFRQVA
jgi:death-on-curing protein